MKGPNSHSPSRSISEFRGEDEWFDEPDELDRVVTALQSIDALDDPVAAAGAIAFRVTRAQGLTEGNKRTALLLATWMLDNNGLDGSRIIDPDDRELADLLVQGRPAATLKARSSGSSPTELDPQQHLVLN